MPDLSIPLEFPFPAYDDSHVWRELPYEERMRVISIQTKQAFASL